MPCLCVFLGASGGLCVEQHIGRIQQEDFCEGLCVYFGFLPPAFIATIFNIAAIPGGGGSIERGNGFLWLS